MGLFNFKKKSKSKITIEEIKSLTNEILNRDKISVDFSKEELYKAARTQVRAYHYNFDEGYQGIYELLEDDFCDKSTALILYWLNSPLYYLNNPDSNHPIHEDGLKLKNYLEKRVLSNDFKEILQFVPIDFIEGPMQMSNDMVEKEPYLNEISIELFLPVGMNYDTTGTCEEFNRYLQLKDIKTFYFFDPVNCSDVKNIPSTESLINLNLCFNGYINTKPKVGSIKDLLHLKDIRRLKMDYYVRFSELNKLVEFKNLQELKINVEKEDYSSLLELKDLKRLALTAPKSSDLNTLKYKSNLESLEILWSPNLIDISSIENLKDLEYFKIEGCKKLRNISPIFSLKKLKTLILKEVQISAKSLKGLNTMSIETLHLDCRKLSNLDFLLTNGKLPESLKEIHLYRSNDNDKLPGKISELNQNEVKIYQYVGFNDILRNENAL